MMQNSVFGDVKLGRMPSDHSKWEEAVRLHSLSALQEEFTLICSNGLSCGYLEEIGLCNQIRQILYLDLALQNT